MQDSCVCNTDVPFCHYSAGGYLKVCHFGNQPQTSSEETPAAERPGESTDWNDRANSLFFHHYSFDESLFFFHRTASSAWCCTTRLLLSCGSVKWAAANMYKQPRLVESKGTAVSQVSRKKTCWQIVTSFSCISVSLLHCPLFFVTLKVFPGSVSIYTSSNAPSVPLWTGSNAGDYTLPGDLPDRPGDDGHGYEGLHWGQTLELCLP